ncbi:MAG: sugar ABC transporter substrate-binding protein [Clostridia bacterium]|jgi:multiple sugar transport system substrate-binding protein|nr:sugar ABC transporter substrate-binding protein [Clostridia bacterium]
MRKILSFALALVMAVGTLAGCGASSSSSSSAAASTAASSTAADAPVTLKWAVWDIDATTYYQPLIDAYQKANPNVTIEMVDLGSTDYMTVLATQLSGGADDLDVITVKDIPGYSNLVNLGMLEPLDKLNTTDTSLYGGTIEQITVDGSYYAVPFRSDFWVVYYNKALFDAAGVDYPTNDMTLDEYDALAREMTSGEGADKVYGCHYHTWRSAVQLFGILNGENTIVDGTYDFLKPYYERILAEQNDGICMDYATLKTSSTHYSGVFYNNQVAMMNMGSWFVATQIEKVKAGESLSTEWGIVKYPHDEGVEAGTTLGTITSLGINSKSSNKEAAADFLNFVCGESGAEIIAGTGTFPAIKTDAVVDTIASIDGFPTDDNSKEALKTVKTYLEMPMDAHAADIETVLNNAHDAIMTESETIDEGIAEMNAGVKAIIG